MKMNDLVFLPSLTLGLEQSENARHLAADGGDEHSRLDRRVMLACSSNGTTWSRR